MIEGLIPVAGADSAFKASTVYLRPEATGFKHIVNLSTVARLALRQNPGLYQFKAGANYDWQELVVLVWEKENGAGDKDKEI